MPTNSSLEQRLVSVAGKFAGTSKSAKKRAKEKEKQQDERLLASRVGRQGEVRVLNSGQGANGRPAGKTAASSAASTLRGPKSRHQRHSHTSPFSTCTVISHYNPNKFLFSVGRGILHCLHLASGLSICCSLHLLVSSSCIKKKSLIRDCYHNSSRSMQRAFQL